MNTPSERDREVAASLCAELAEHGRCWEGRLKDGCHEPIAQALASARAEGMQAGAQAERGAWQPIETAPRDGTPIILCYRSNAVGEARWVDHAWYWAGNDPSDSWGQPV